MTNEGLNQRIAAALGWTKLPKDLASMVQYTAQRPDGKWGMVPDYCNDLNAMHEAESQLTKGQRKVYIDLLLAADDTRVPYEECWFYLHATARQRAEAFYRTLNPES